MGELSIKIKIADKEYPMRVEASEEEIIRTAAKQVNEKLKTFKDLYGIDDKQDLLAMVAFDAIIHHMRASDVDKGAASKITEKMAYLESLISSTLKD